MACRIGEPFRAPLLELPLEIRLRIYEFVFTGSRIYVQLVGENSQDRRLHIHGADNAIFFASRQLYHETCFEWYTANIWTVGFPPALGFFLRSTSSEILARVKHLTVQIYELPDLNTKLLPSLRMLIIDFTTDLPSFMAGAWYDYDDDKIYSRFADEAIDRVHSTFKVLITQLHEEERTFHLGLLARNYYHTKMPRKQEEVNAKVLPQRIELYVNLDTKLVERRWIDPVKIGNDDLCPQDKPVPVKEPRARTNPSTSEALTPEHHLEACRHLLYFNRYKFPPGREGSFSGEDEDDRGSIRGSEQESSSDDSDQGDEEAGSTVKGANWEAVKRIIEHPSEDEQSASEAESEDDNTIAIVGEEEISESKQWKDEIDYDLEGLLTGSLPLDQGPEQEQGISTDVFRGGDKETETKVQVAAVHAES